MLAEKLKRVRNLRVGVKETANGIVFLHSIEPGAASKSYGIEGSKAGGASSSSHRARKACLAAAREAGTPERTGRDNAEPMQLTIFTPLSQRIVDRIETVDVNALTPLQALNLLEELQQELKEKA